MRSTNCIICEAAFPERRRKRAVSKLAMLSRVVPRLIIPLAQTKITLSARQLWCRTLLHHLDDRQITFFVALRLVARFVFVRKSNILTDLARIAARLIYPLPPPICFALISPNSRDLCSIGVHGNVFIHSDCPGAVHLICLHVESHFTLL